MFNLLRKLLISIFVLLALTSVTMAACTSDPQRPADPSEMSVSLPFTGNAKSNCMAATLHWCATRKNGFTLTCANQVLWLADLTEYVFCAAETDRQVCVFDGESHRYPYAKCASTCSDPDEHYFETFDDVRTAAAALRCTGAPRPY